MVLEQVLTILCQLLQWLRVSFLDWLLQKWWCPLWSGHHLLVHSFAHQDGSSGLLSGLQQLRWALSHPWCPFPHVPPAALCHALLKWILKVPECKTEETVIH